VRQFCVGSILLSTALSSSAVTLGRHSGAGIIGRPLDIRVQALLSPGEDIANLCVNADVLYGDVKVSPDAVRTTVQRASPDAEPSVRIQSLVAIDEPIVTVFVRAGCTTPFTRRYVLLADPVSEPSRIAAPSAASQPQSAAPATMALPTVPSASGTPLPAAPAAEQAGRKEAAPRAPAARQPVRDRTRAAERPARPARPASVVRKPAAPPPDPTPRLELDAVDLSLAIERDPVLKLSLSLLSEPTTSEETRAAAGLLWKAINASPEDILRDAQKLQVLEAESKGLREAEARNQATIAELSSTVEQSRLWQWMVYLLGALLALAALALVWLWRRQKSSRDFDAAKAWWASEGTAKAAPREPALGRKSEAAAAVDIDLDLSDESSAGELRPLSRAQDLEDSASVDLDSTPAAMSMAGMERRDFAPSQLASRSVAAEELFDVQQQAEFFMSLGEDEQAIHVLRNHIQDSQVPSALAYLDLFKVYHRLGRRADYETLRTDFNKVFNAGAPPFDQYSDVSLGLEAYETAFGRIQALWPEPRVLDVIEKSIFREPGDAEGEVFDLEAYRELLLLHTLAKELIQRDATETEPDSEAPKDFRNTKVQPLKATGKLASVAGGGAATQPMDLQPPASPNLGLDVNLDDMSEFSAFEASLPEVAAPVEPTAKPRSQRDSDDRDEAGNLIDFEVLDFTEPDGEGADEDDAGGKPGDAKR
jgi:hypothetical protein